jgi:hypothetical protein
MLLTEAHMEALLSIPRAMAKASASVLVPHCGQGYLLWD